MKFTDDQMTQLEQLIAASLSPINLQLTNGEKRMDGFAREIGDLALKQTVNNVKTDLMFDAFDAAKKGLAVLGSIGNGLKWAAGIVGAVVAAWAAMKGKL